MQKQRKINNMSLPFSDEDLQEPVNTIIKNKVAPMLAQDGGAISLLKIENGNIFVQLQGSCVGCAASSSTLKFIVEKEIKAAIHPELRIINVPIGMEDKMGDLV
jgi:Fe-S cluster biogenesis protein NfuA